MTSVQVLRMLEQNAFSSLLSKSTLHFTILAVRYSGNGGNRLGFLGVFSRDKYHLRFAFFSFSFFF